MSAEMKSDRLESKLAVLFHDLSRETLLWSIPALTCELAQSKTALFLQPHPEHGFSIISHAHAPGTLISNYHLISSCLHESVPSTDIVHISDILAEWKHTTESDRQLAVDFGYRAMTGIPVPGKNSLQGVLVLFYPFSTPLTEETISLLGRWSRFCGMALEQSTTIQKTPEPLNNKLASDTSQQDNMQSQLGILSASIAHEVNNSLDGIKNYLYLLTTETPADSPNKEYLSIIESEINRTGNIVQQLSQLSQPEKSLAKSVPINELIRSTIPLMNHLLTNKKIEFKLELSPVLPHITGIADQLKSVFMNLFINAIQAIPSSGTITVTSQVNPENQGQIKLTFRDTGSGILPKDIDNVFKPFFTTKKKGTGLGLTICKQIIKSHGGSIQVQSKSSSTPTRKSGTIITILLPIQEGDKR